VRSRISSMILSGIENFKIGRLEKTGQ